MRPSWNDRVVPAAQREFLRRVQQRAACRLAGGAALSGLHLNHRLSRDLDLFCDDKASVRDVVQAATEVASDLGGELVLVRDGGSFVRGRLTLPDNRVELDVAHEPSAPLGPRDVVDGVTVDGFDDLTANKLTCLLSRAEPRDLVDLYFLDQDGFRPEGFLSQALTKDAGIDPGLLSLLVRDFPTSPMPTLLRSLDDNQLRGFRQALSERFLRVALPD